MKDELEELQLTLKRTLSHGEYTASVTLPICSQDPLTLAHALSDVMPFNVQTNVDVLMVTMILLTDPLREHDCSKQWYWPALELMWNLRREKQAKEEESEDDE